MKLDEDDILAELVEADADPHALTAVEIARVYEVSIAQEDEEAIEKADKWQHIKGVLHRRKAIDIDFYDGSYSFQCKAESLADLILALKEEVDDITGRKSMEEAGEAFGMF